MSFPFGAFGGGGAFASSATAAASAPAGGCHASQWYYYLQNDPNGMPDGWYEYDNAINLSVEQMFQNAGTSSHRHKKPRLSASSGYSYELDFQRMMQRNTSSGRERPIQRTTNGLPPQGLPAGVGVSSSRRSRRAAAAAAAAAMALPVVPAAVPPSMGDTLNYTAPEVLHEVKVDEAKVFVDVAPPEGKPKAKDDEEKKNDSYTKASHDDDCVICLDLLWSGPHGGERVVALKGCQHKFHYSCIHEALTKAGGKCPLCSKPIQQEEADSPTSKGKCPSATMTVRTVSQSCSGYNNVGSLEISYRIPNGIQKSYHPQPGSHFSGANRNAYLPDNTQGQDLLSRMQYAFMHGLSFMVGTSLTTGRANTVTWASIHHKTSYGGGTYGFPDDTYFDRANDELDQLGVLAPAACRTWLQNKCPGYDL